MLPVLLCVAIFVQGFDAAIIGFLPAESHGLRLKRDYMHHLDTRASPTPESPVAGRALADYNKPFTLSYSKEDGPKFGGRNNKDEPKYYQPFKQGVNNFFAKPTESVASRGNFFYFPDDEIPYEYPLTAEERYRIVNPIYVEVGPKTYL